MIKTSHRLKVAPNTPVKMSEEAKPNTPVKMDEEATQCAGNGVEESPAKKLKVDESQTESPTKALFSLTTVTASTADVDAATWH